MEVDDENNRKTSDMRKMDTTKNMWKLEGTKSMAGGSKKVLKKKNLQHELVLIEQRSNDVLPEHEQMQKMSRNIGRKIQEAAQNEAELDWEISGWRTGRQHCIAVYEWMQGIWRAQHQPAPATPVYQVAGGSRVAPASLF